MYSETRHGAKHPIAPLSRLYTSHSDSIRPIFDRVRSRLSLVGRHSARKWWRAPGAAYVTCNNAAADRSWTARPMCSFEGVAGQAVVGRRGIPGHTNKDLNQNSKRVYTRFTLTPNFHAWSLASARRQFPCCPSTRVVSRSSSSCQQTPRLPCRGDGMERDTGYVAIPPV